MGRCKPKYLKDRKYAYYTILDGINEEVAKDFYRKLQTRYPSLSEEHFAMKELEGNLVIYATAKESAWRGVKSRAWDDFKNEIYKYRKSLEEKEAERNSKELKYDELDTRIIFNELMHLDLSAPQINKIAWTLRDLYEEFDS